MQRYCFSQAVTLGTECLAYDSEQQDFTGRCEAPWACTAQRASAAEYAGHELQTYRNRANAQSSSLSVAPVQAWTPVVFQWLVCTGLLVGFIPTLFPRNPQGSSRTRRLGLLICSQRQNGF